MTSGNYPGLFRRRGDTGSAPVPGELSVDDAGEIRLELRGASAQMGGLIPQPEPIIIEGELSSSRFAGSDVTLFGCLQTGWRFGSGGVTESWLAHRALIGYGAAEDDERFDRITARVENLAAFLGAAPTGVRFEERRIEVDLTSRTLAAADLGDWKVAFIRRPVGRWSPNSVHVEEDDAIEVHFESPQGADEVRMK